MVLLLFNARIPAILACIVRVNVCYNSLDEHYCYYWFIDDGGSCCVSHLFLRHREKDAFMDYIFSLYGHCTCKIIYGCENKRKNPRIWKLQFQKSLIELSRINIVITDKKKASVWKVCNFINWNLISLRDKKKKHCQGIVSMCLRELLCLISFQCWKIHFVDNQFRAELQKLWKVSAQHTYNCLFCLYKNTSDCFQQDTWKHYLQWEFFFFCNEKNCFNFME